MLQKTWEHRYIFNVTIFFLGYIPRSGIAASHDSYIFNFLRDLHTVFHNDCTSLNFHQQYASVLFSPHPVSTCYLLLFDKSYPNTCQKISHCGFDIHFPYDLVMFNTFSFPIWSFRCLWINVYSGPSLIFNWIYFFKWYKFLVYFDINHLSDMWIINIFSQSIGCLFILLMISFAMQELCSLM